MDPRTLAAHLHLDREGNLRLGGGARTATPRFRQGLRHLMLDEAIRRITGARR